jgi:tetratricopeptide (TPR) repeat protein
VWSYSTNSVYRYTSVPATVYPSPVVSGPIVAASTLPAPATAGELRTSSDRELGDTYLRLGDPDNATRVYQQHLDKHPGDAQAIRVLGVAQVVSGRLAEGVEQIERAYRVDPSLADRPLMPQAVFAAPEDFQRALDLTTRTANGSNSGAAWLAAAVMLQADGRTGPARSALERAKGAGLDPAVYDWMKGVLPDQSGPAPTAPGTSGTGTAPARP